MNLVSRTYKLDTDLADLIVTTATNYHVNPSDLVRYLLGYALRQVVNGKLKIKTRPVMWGVEDGLAVPPGDVDLRGA
jgi:hypothetical protein